MEKLLHWLEVGSPKRVHDKFYNGTLMTQIFYDFTLIFRYVISENQLNLCHLRSIFSVKVKFVVTQK